MSKPRTRALLVPLAVVMTLGYLVPLAWLIPKSLATPTGIGLDNYARIMTEPLYRIVAERTFRVALLTAIGCLVIGYPLAWLLGRLPRNWFRLVAIVISVPLLTSTVVRSEAWVILLLPEGIINSVLNATHVDFALNVLHRESGVTIAMTQVLLPIALLPLLAAFYDLDWNLVGAARNLGANKFQVWRQVIFPLTSSAAETAFGLTFVLALGFWITPSIIGGGRVQLLAPLISTEASQMQDFAMASALSVSLMLTVGLLVGTYGLATRRRRAR